ncbi:membrane protein insertion efficiency factor YidD [Mycobacterium shinjukuense]|nr:membrane protein insertion efficiency factor YidD [Mycobacterium shinjukuense]
MVSPLRPASCRFVPTCSKYAVDALTEYGLTRGGWLTVVRLAKCGPWHPGGWDPIPERRERAEKAGTGRGAATMPGESEPVV